MGTTISIFIQGIILFVSSGVYGTGEVKANTGAAIAIHSAGRTGSYGVVLPAHKTQLILVKSEVLTYPMPAIFSAVGTEYVANLVGHRVQVGKVVTGVCTATSGSGATGNLSAMNVPDLKKLNLPSTVLADSARPTSAGEYKDIDKTLVSGWLEMRDGDLTTEGTSAMTAEFRPATTVTYSPILRVLWKTPNAAPCLIITPFGGASEVVVFNSGISPVVRYENRPVVTAGHRHGRAFASYDFELLYDVLEKKHEIRIPPIPHNRFLDVMIHGEAPFLRDCVRSCAGASTPASDPVSGMNCGPGNDPDPGDPKP